jgi:pimeloyl-ACP methyl ester carboxylesterase
MPLVRDFYYAETVGTDPTRPVVVLVHGAGSDHRCWPVEVRRLSGWRVLAVDLPGHGRSSGRPRQSVRAYTQDLLFFLNELQIFRAVLVGHSLGAAVVLQLALEQPDLLAGLGLISASAHLEAPPSLIDYFTNPLTIPLAVQLFQQWAFSPQTTPARIETGLELLRAARPAVLAGDWRAFAHYDLPGELGQISAPAWVAAGGDDRLAPLPCAHFLAARLPHARLQVIPNAGHMLLHEQPAALVAGLRAFLESLSPLERSSPALLARQNRVSGFQAR